MCGPYQLFGRTAVVGDVPSVQPAVDQDTVGAPDGIATVLANCCHDGIEAYVVDPSIRLRLH